MNVSSLSRSLLARMSSLSAAVVEPQPIPGADKEEEGGHRGLDGSPEESYCHMKNCDMYPHKERVVDDDCPEYSEPLFDLLSGESVEFVGFSDGDYFVISNYRFFATHVQRNGFYNVPLGMIECAEVQHRKEEMLVLCKDARSFRLVFNSALKCKIWQERLLESLRCSVRTLKSTFAFVHRAYSRDQKMEGSQQSGTNPPTALHSLKGKGNHQASSKAVTTPACAMGLWVTAEHRRMGMDLDCRWKITQCNDKYEVCRTYPKLFVVPHSITDKEVKLVAKFRMLGRVPAVVWRHPTNGCVIVRSSQPQVGVLGIWRSPEDEKLLLAISRACMPFPHHIPFTKREGVYRNGGPPCTQILDEVNGGPGRPVQNGQMFSDSEESDLEEERGRVEEERGNIPKLLVMDLRSYTAALGNRAKGGGFECHEYYPNCEIQFKNLPNIHSVRKSFQQLRSVLASEDQTSFLSGLEGTQWLFYLCQLLSVACEVVASLHNDACPVLVHCSDGWDRTSQIVALAELMLDPYYRTIEGFQVLVEREWLAYGHKFGDRCGHNSEDSNQRSPVFLQWLDCVHQLMRQFPCDFKFNEAFLVKLGQHCYSCLFGTFLGNSVCVREGERVGEETLSLWSLLHANNPDFVNYLYCPGTSKVLHPVPHIRNMLLWKEMYCSAVLVPYNEEGRGRSPYPSMHSSSRTSSGGDLSSQQGFHTRGCGAGTTPQPVPLIVDSAINGLMSGRGERDDPSTESLYHSLKEPGLDHNHDHLEETLVAAEAKIGSVNVKLDSRALDTNLLEDIQFDDPDIAPSVDTVPTNTRTTSLGLGVDGLPPATDAVHQRLLNIELQHSSKVAELQAQLKQARNGREVEDEKEGERRGVQNEEKCTPEEQLPSSLQSWDYVDHGDSTGVRWVPDHASSHCQGCGATFWAIIRKHHCRSCGGVFCSTCANYFCPVPNEQLFDNVRVCEKCFYKLDGHLHQKSPQMSTLPT